MNISKNSLKALVCEFWSESHEEGSLLFNLHPDSFLVNPDKAASQLAIAESRVRADQKIGSNEI